MTQTLSATEVNPLRESLPRALAPEPCAVVLFGSTGDLAARKLVPALENLARGGNMPAEFAVVGYARRDWTDQQYRDEMTSKLKKGGDGDKLWPDFARHLAFASGTFTEPEGYAALKAKLEELDRTHGTQ